MHESKATVPVERSADVARLALDVGIAEATIYEVFVHGPDKQKHVVSVEVSTPHAKAFLDALLDSSLFDPGECTITSRELRAIVSSVPTADLTRPMIEPAADVIQDLWQLSHVTAGYIGRAAGGALLLADGMIRNSPISIVAAALFLPFLSQVLAAGFGGWSGDRDLLKTGVLALLTSSALAVAAGAVVALVSGGPILFNDFRSPLASFAISAVIGIAAGLAIADDAGRRYLIGVAAAVQFGVFPVWFGAAAVIGFPARHIVLQRLLTFCITIVTISGAAVCAYTYLGLRRKELRRLISPRRL